MNRLLSPVVVSVSLIALFVLFAGVAYGQEDITPPSLLDVSFEPEVIDTSKGPVTITVTVHVTDDLSGVRWVGLFFHKEGTTQQAQVELRPSEGWSEIIQGDLLDGYHVGTMTLPQYSAFGTWEMFTVGTEDNVGNLFWQIKPENEGQNLGDDQWLSLFNGFNFEVGASGAPQEPEVPVEPEEPEQPQVPAQRLFIPLVNN